jgi:hypothetical protein
MTGACAVQSNVKIYLRHLINKVDIFYSIIKLYLLIFPRNVADKTTLQKLSLAFQTERT